MCWKQWRCKNALERWRVVEADRRRLRVGCNDPDDRHDFWSCGILHTACLYYLIGFLGDCLVFLSSTVAGSSCDTSSLPC